MPPAEILIVDDTPANLSVLFDHLRQSGFKVLIAPDGESALRQMRRRKPDLILLDVKMSGIDGFETCRQIKADEALKDIPVLFMTVVLETPDKVKGFEVGGVDYITKPIEVPEVEARVRTHLELRRLQRELETERIQLRREIADREKAEMAVVQAQKRDSLGLQAAGIAHEFNNILVSVLGQLSLALGKLKPDDPAQDHLRKAEVGAMRAADLTQQMLAYTGKSFAVMAGVDLNQLIEQHLELLTMSIPSNRVQVRTSLSQPLPLIRADAGQIQQIITNIVLNAAEAISNDGNDDGTKGGNDDGSKGGNDDGSKGGNDDGSEGEGKIILVTDTRQVSDFDSEFWQHTGQPLPAGEYVYLGISDDGEGMSDETQTKIFDPFFSTRFTGRGLGLAASLGIVKGHQGGIAVRSEVGQGSEFGLVFPVHVVDMVS